MLRRLGAASAIAIGGAGVVTADGATGIRWQFEDGHVETLTVEEFHRREDTPTVDDVTSEYECCGCPDAPIDCVWCTYPDCDDDELE